METLTFQCGHCNKLMAVGTAHLGQQVRCPHCQQVVVAPSQPAPATHAPAESPFGVAPDAAPNADTVPDAASRRPNLPHRRRCPASFGHLEEPGRPTRPPTFAPVRVRRR